MTLTSRQTRLRDMLAEGKTLREIGKVLHQSQPALRAIALDLGFPLPADERTIAVTAPRRELGHEPLPTGHEWSLSCLPPLASFGGKPLARVMFR